MAEHNLAAHPEDIRERLGGLSILYHQLFRGVTEAELLQEVRDGYQGDVISGKDLDVYQLAGCV